VLEAADDNEHGVDDKTVEVGRTREEILSVVQG
jgi:hypothetical protein